MFALRLFGGLSLESGTVQLSPGAQQRRRLSLLALLALAGERGISRERIQAYLWPESSPDRARHALDQLLYASRRDLGSDAILSSATELRLNSALIQVDLWEFDRLIEAERWEDAVEMYAGPVMDGVHIVDGAEFERLLDAERMSRQHEYWRALECRARACDARGDISGAVRWWRRRAASDPLSLPVALELMRVLATANERAAAIQHARVYQRLIRETLEIEPDPAIERLATEIASSAQPARPRQSVAAGAVMLTSLAEPAPDPVVTLPHGAAHGASDGSRLWRSRTAAWLAIAVMISVGLGSSIKTGLFARTRASQPPLPASKTATVSASNAPTVGGATAGTADLQARALYLRGRAAWNERTKNGLDSAVVLFRLAIQRDPLYAAAYTGLADSYAMIGYFGFAPADPMFAKAKAAASRALELDASAGEAYAALGQALAWQHDWVASENSYRRAIALAPDDATVHQWYGLMLSYVGRAHEAAMQTGEASRLDPLSVQINNMHGMMLYYDGDLAGALRQYDRTVLDEPDSAWVRQNPWVLANFGRVAAAAGRHEQAIRLIERALVVVPRNPRAQLNLAAAYVYAGDTARARAAFARADTTHPHYAFYKAWSHALFGELDDAFRWLDKIDEWPLPPLVALTNDPSLAKLRADPRYHRIQIRLRFVNP